MFVQAVMRAAQIRRDAPATIDGTRIRTWGESADRTARLAGALVSLGCKRGDRVGILSLNSDRYLEAIHATWWCGAVVVPMNTRWALAEHVYSLDDAGFRILFVDDAHAQIATQLKAERGNLNSIVYLGDTAPAGMVAMETLIDGTPAMAPAPGGNAELAGIFYTGGTTGMPKGVMHSALSLWAGATCLALEMTTPDYQRYLHAAPMFHLGDLVQAFATTAKAGTHVFLPRFSPAGVIEAVRAHRVDITLLVPTMIGMLLDTPALDPKGFESLKVLTFGGSPISDAVLERMRAAFPQARLVQGFGQTETVATGSVLLYEDAGLLADERRRRSVGRAPYGIELGIFDQEGHPQAIGEVGEIWVRGPSAMLGYWNKPEQTAGTLTDGWVHTGDAGYLDERGYLYVCDRVKDMVISGGENVFSAEVEAAIASCDVVAQVAVIGVPDERWGERVHAVIVPQANAQIDLETIQSHCRTRIAGYKVPRSMEIRQSPLPLSAVGKVLKAELRAPHWRGRSRNVN